MPALNLMSWNVYGGDLQALADTIKGTHAKGMGVNLDLDLIMLEEAQNKSSATFYNPLKAIAAYAIAGPYLENFSMIKLPSGSNVYAAQGVNRSYSIVYKSSTITINGAALVNLVNDPHVVSPKDAITAAQMGLNQRPPLAVDFSHKTGGGSNRMMMFAWHAPVHPFTHAVLQIFDGSKALADAETKTKRVIIAGDLNTSDVSKVFNTFGGIQDKFDFILSNFGTVGDMRSALPASGPILDELWGDAHPAIAGRISY